MFEQILIILIGCTWLIISIKISHLNLVATNINDKRVLIVAFIVYMQALKIVHLASSTNMKLTNIIKNRKYWTAIGFGSYIISIFVFALIYNRLFAYDSRNFSFNSDIQTARVSFIKSSTTSELEKLHLQLEAYKQLELVLGQQVDISALAYNKKPFVLTKNGYKYVFQTIESEIERVVGPPQSQKYYQLILRVYDKDGNQIDISAVSLFYFPFQTNLKTLQHHASYYTEILKNSINKDKKRLVKMTSSNPQIWSFWDFLYFSVITQTTVGYGDVLPNTTLLRIIIIIQVLTGLAIPSVVINLLFLTLKQPNSR